MVALLLLLPLISAALSLAAVVVIAGTRKDRLRRRAAVAGSMLLLLHVTSAAYWAWLLRDGLGPDSIRSSGRVAWQRFLDGWVWSLGFASVVVVCGFVAWLTTRERPERMDSHREGA